MRTRRIQIIPHKHLIFVLIFIMKVIYMHLLISLANHTFAIYTLIIAFFQKSFFDKSFLPYRLCLIFLKFFSQLALNFVSQFFWFRGSLTPILRLRTSTFTPLKVPTEWQRKHLITFWRRIMYRRTKRWAEKICSPLFKIN